MIAAYILDLVAGSDYDRRKVCNSTVTVLDISYLLAKAQYFNLKFSLH